MADEMGTKRTMRTYYTTDVVAVPESIPEAGVKAGDVGVVDSVYDEGRMMLVEVPRPGGTIAALLDVRVEDDGDLTIVSYSAYAGP